MTTIHMRQSVRGALRNQSFDLFEGKSRIETFDILCDLLAGGTEFIPLGECDNFDPKKGCLGHPEAKAVEFPAPPAGCNWQDLGAFTAETFGVGDGYRPLYIGERSLPGDEWYFQGTWTVAPADDDHMPVMGVSTAIHRTKRGLPSTQVIVELSADDIPAVCWMRNSEFNHRAFLVVAVLRRGVQLFGYSRENPVLSWETLRREGWHYGPDRINWLPCSKEVG